MRELPRGTVTFVFTDVDRLDAAAAELGAEGYADALAEHRRVVRETVERHGGVEVDTQGDAFFFAFAMPPTRCGPRARWRPGPCRCGSACTRGRPLVTDEGYVGADVHLAARVAAAANGGQVC